ncbi:MAG: hypothetical protein ABSF38_03495 [Verrucomicrobiota bacterium]
MKKRLGAAESNLHQGDAPPAGPSVTENPAGQTSFLPLSRNWRWFFVASLLVGAVLRVSFGGDIEFKYDEWFMFDQTQKAGITEPLPTLGMESAVGVRNPPLSIWMFLALRRVFFSTTPPELARAVQILNILALAGLLLFALRGVEARWREPWLWAFALVCVNPIAIFLQRKIWAQSTLPLFCVLALWAWSNRDRRPGALLWGLLGIWLGQIHLSGFIFTLALVIWTAASEALGQSNRKTAWGPWLIGLGLGLLTMLSWLDYYFHLNHQFSWIRFFLRWFSYPQLHSMYWQVWVSDPLGLGLTCSLGDREFLEYLKYPLIAGNPTGLMGMVHVVILGLAGAAFLRFLLRFWRQPVSLQCLILGRSGSDNSLLLAAAFTGYGILLTLNVGLLPRHYLVITFPLEWLWWTWIFKEAFPARLMRWMLLGLWGCQLILSIGYLGYIHVNHGAPTGDYGVAYQFQHPVFTPPPQN